MATEYIKFLHEKLYLIEHLSLHGRLAGDEEMRKIHDIAIGTPSFIKEELRKLGGNDI